MTLDLLDAPLRVTWDLHGPAGPAPPAAVAAVADALAAAGVFFVTLDRAPLAHPGFAALGETLAAGGCRVTAVTGGGAGELATLRRTSFRGEVLLDADPFLAAGRLDRDGLDGALEGLRTAGFEPGLRLVPWASRLPLIPLLADFCRDRRVAHFKLPNLPAGASVTPAGNQRPPRPEDITAFRELASGRSEPLTAGLHAEVHDLFLWEILRPAGGGRSEYGGCQAGNSLGHVDAAGDVHPCTSWPERLGSLTAQPLAEIWASPQRRELRRRVAATADGCRGCRDLAVCFGGCRGLAFAGFGAAGRDPGCPGPR